MLRKRSRLSLVGLDQMAAGELATPRRSLSMLLCQAGGAVAEPWAGAARSTAPETFFDESGSFLHPRRTSSVPLLCSGGGAGEASPGSPGDGGSPLDWEPSQAPDAGGAAGGYGGCVAWGSDPDGASDESPTKRSAWGRFASALSASEQEAAVRAAEDAQLQRVGSGDVEGVEAWRARGLGGPGAGAAAGWGAGMELAASQPPLSQPGAASQLLIAVPPLRSSFQSPGGHAWVDPGCERAHAAPAPSLAHASQPPAAHPAAGAASDGGMQLPFAGDAWHASQVRCPAAPGARLPAALQTAASCRRRERKPARCLRCLSRRAPRLPRDTPQPLTRARPARQPPPFEFFSQRESQAAAHLPPPPPFAGRGCGDATRTPPHYSMDSYMPHGCALDMSPGETGGSQYIASPLVHHQAPSQPRGGAELPLPPHVADGSQGDGPPGSQGAGDRMPLFPIFMVRLTPYGLALSAARLTRLPARSPAGRRRCTWCATARVSTTRRAARPEAPGTTPSSGMRPCLRWAARRRLRWGPRCWVGCRPMRCGWRRR